MSGEAPNQPASPPPPAEGAARPRWKSHLFRAVKLALLAAVLFFVGRALVRQVGSLDWSAVHFRPGYVALAFLSVVAARTTILLIYRPLLEPFCGRLGFADLAPLSWIPMLGRYVPGKVFSVAWAVSMLRKRGTSTAAAVSVPFLMMGLAVLTGLLVAVPLTLSQPIRDRIPAAWAWCAALLVPGIVCLHPKVLGAAGNFVLRKLKREGTVVLPSVGRYLAAVGAILAQLVCAGVGLWLLSRSLTDVSIVWLPVFISATGLAASIGFLAIFAPAGIGVREGILLVILLPAVGEGVAAVIVIAVRCLQTVVEIVLAGVGFLVLRTTGESPLRRSSGT